MTVSEKLSGRLWSTKKTKSNDLSLNDTNGDESVAAGDAPIQYRTYKRRWFGLLQLVLMNIVVSWDVSIHLKTLITPKDFANTL